MPLVIPDAYANGDEAAIGQVSDGYHTFDELYAHRFALFLALCRALDMGWKSKTHSDGSSYPGWFIAGMTLPMVGDISYHLPLHMWKVTPYLLELEYAPSWDGHTSNDVIDRLRLFAALDQESAL
jgi:hypothetical protein